VARSFRGNSCGQTGTLKRTGFRIMDIPVRSPFVVTVDPSGTQPLFVQIASGVIDAIRRGRLSPGARLPGSRAFGATLGVHRSTVVVAYRELLSQGWIVGTVGKGTFVSRALPDVKPRRFADERRGVPDRASYFLPAPPPTDVIPEQPPRGVLSFASGI